MASNAISLLLIEDERDALEMLQRFISMSFPDVIVHSAYSLRDARYLFKNFRHDIVVTDVRLPKKEDGIDLTSDICKEKGEAIILITGDTAISLRTLWEAEPNCTEALVVKPDVRNLLDEIEQTIIKVTNRIGTDTGH